MIRLCYCGDGNPRHARIAHAAGWLYGVRLPARGMADEIPLYMADQDWKKPNRTRYMACLQKYRPAIASVLDWEEPDGLPEVLSWALEASQHVREAILIVPKVPGGVPDIPRRIGGKDVVLAYSVPSSYGGSPLGLWELKGWPVHLLGGSPQKQMEIYRHLRGICDVRSVDGNVHKKLATSRCLYWTNRSGGQERWTAISGFDGNGPDEAFRRSCINIREAWEKQP